MAHPYFKLDVFPLLLPLAFHTDVVMY
uniref:Uncharacterized protein n=1 Tax=Anguilla anguilla TaxID=7936 RepID=A0A0E9VER2_ANGAN